MDKISELSEVVLILIRVGVVFRIAFIFFQMIGSEDEVHASKRRISNTLKFYIAAELVFILKAVIMYYY